MLLEDTPENLDFCLMMVIKFVNHYKQKFKISGCVSELHLSVRATLSE